MMSKDNSSGFLEAVGSIIVIAIIISILAIAGLGIYIDGQNKIAQQKAEESAQLEEDYKNGNFALMISRDLISESDAKNKYLNKHLTARGSITKYEDTYEIKITDLSQIVIK